MIADGLIDEAKKLIPFKEKYFKYCWLQRIYFVFKNQITLEKQ